VELVSLRRCNSCPSWPMLRDDRTGFGISSKWPIPTHSAFRGYMDIGPLSGRVTLDRPYVWLYSFVPG
jgi:hypothetical protein